MSNIDKSYFNREVDLDAQHYILNSDLQQTLAAELLTNIKIQKYAKILDIGCGDGRITAELANRASCGSVIGLDSSSSMVNTATALYRDVYPNLFFLQCKAEDYNAEVKYDLITSFSSFHWVKEGNKTLQKLLNYLKPGGELVILTYPAESPYYIFMQEALENNHFNNFAKLSAYHTMLSVGGYHSTLITANMDIDRFEVKNLFTVNPSFEKVKDFIQGWLTSFVPLPNQYHYEYLNLVIEKCLPYVRYGDNNSIELPYTELVICARKQIR